MYVTVLLSFASCGWANTDVEEHDLNDKLLDSLIKTKDSRSFLSDLIYKIQLLLNDTDDQPQQHSTVAAAPKSTQTSEKSGGVKSSTGVVTQGPAVTVSSSSSSSKSTSNSSSTNSVLGFRRNQLPQKLSKKQSRIKSQDPPMMLSQQQTSLLVNVTLESLLALPGNMTMDAMQIFNMTGFMSNETVVDVAAEREAKRNAIGADASQRVATLGVIICLTFVGTATCIVVMALYSSKFSGIILLSNGRWWCPMVTRGNGVERQLLV